MEFSKCRGGVWQGHFPYVFCNSPKCFKSPFNKPDLKFYFIFGLLRGKNKNVLDLPKNHFKDKKVADFPYVRGEGSTNIWKIPYMFFADHF